MTLEQVKATVTDLDLRDILKEGLCLSEPILSRNRDLVIDNFFTYGIDYEEKAYTQPLKQFGIDAQNKQVVYVKECSPCKSELKIVPAASWDFYDPGSYSTYSELYGKVRNVFGQISMTPFEKSVLVDYCKALKHQVDENMWPFYINLYPVFFEWLKESI